MQHLDPDRLVTLALGEGVADDAESTHLAGCPECWTELDALRHIADLGAETEQVRDLPAPPDRVWAAIASEVALQAGPVPVRHQARPRRATPRWLSPLVAAAAAAVLAVAGTLTVVRLSRPDPAVTASAALARLALAPADATGDARVLADGELRIDVAHLPPTTGHYEVWLLDADNTTKMQSLGNLPAAEGVVYLPIPPGTDLTRYRLVDVSVEQNDGNSAHSGKSLLRGSLES